MDWVTFKAPMEGKLLWDLKCKEPKSNYIFYFESKVFDKMLDRKFIIFIWLYDVAAYIIDMSETN